MIRGTTIAKKMIYPKLLTFCTVAFWQGETEISVTPDVQETDEGCIVTATLSQEQTLMFSVGVMFWQIRGICADGAVASQTYAEIVSDVHPDGVIEAEEPEEEIEEPEEEIEEPEEEIEEPAEEAEEVEDENQ